MSDFEGPASLSPVQHLNMSELARSVIRNIYLNEIRSILLRQNMLTDAVMPLLERVAAGSSLYISGVGSRQLDTSSSDQLDAFDNCYQITRPVVDLWPADNSAHCIALVVCSGCVGSEAAGSNRYGPLLELMQVRLVGFGDVGRSNTIR